MGYLEFVITANSGIGFVLMGGNPSSSGWEFWKYSKGPHLKTHQKNINKNKRKEERKAKPSPLKKKKLTLLGIGIASKCFSGHLSGRNS